MLRQRIVLVAPGPTTLWFSNVLEDGTETPKTFEGLLVFLSLSLFLSLPIDEIET